MQAEEAMNDILQTRAKIDEWVYRYEKAFG